LVLALVAFYLVGSRNGISRNPVFAVIDPEEGLKLKEIHFSQNNPEKAVKWVLDASEVRVSKDQRIISFSDFRLRLEPDNRQAIELRGKRGDYDKDSGRISLSGDLKGRTDDGYEILTESATFTQNEGDLKTDDPVKIIGPFFTVEGRGFNFNIERETFTILSEAMTTIKDESQIL